MSRTAHKRESPPGDGVELLVDGHRPMKSDESVAAVYAAAQEAFRAGLCVLPPAEDGTKRPQSVDGTWQQFKKERPSEDRRRTWWPGRTGLGIVTGAVSGEIECPDFDCRDTYKAFCEIAQSTGLGEVVARIEAGYCDDTPGDGVRWLWKCPGAGRKHNQKLASRPKRPEEKKHEKDNVKVLIELPDYAIVAPSNGTVHKSGKAYVRRSGSFDSITTITVEERNSLLELARSFDEMPRSEVRTPGPKMERNVGSRPGDDYNAQTSWRELLEPNGWTKIYRRGQTDYWRRPGKTFGISATTNFRDSDLFYPFSSSTEFESERGYSKFAVYAVFNHGGDFKAAARALGNEGYGNQAKSPLRQGEGESSSEKAMGIGRNDFLAHMPTHRYIFKPTRDVWPAGSVNARIPPRAVGHDENGNLIEQTATAWLDKNRPVEQMTWAPGEAVLIKDRLVSEGGWIPQVGCHCFNLYRPPTVEPGDPGKATRWLDHITLVYPDDVRHILQWLAHRVQRPQEKINHALLLGGNQGVGKDTILEPVKHAVGPWNCKEVSPSHLLGRFNGFVKSVILRVSEARDLGDVNRYAFYEHMKVYTAAPPDVLLCDEKNLREYSVPNVCGVVITSNHRTDSIYLPSDDRRHYVAWSELSREDFKPDYWTSLYGWYENEGNAAVTAYLQELDISSFDPKAPPPHTQAFSEIVDANRAPEDAELADVLDALGNPDAVTLLQIAKRADVVFSDWLKDRRNNRQVPHRLESAGYVRVLNDADRTKGLWTINGKRQAIYARQLLSVRDRMQAASKLARQGRS